MLRRALKRKQTTVASTHAHEQPEERAPVRKTALGERTEEELNLEKAVLGDDQQILDSLELKSKKTTFCIDGRKADKPTPAWYDRMDRKKRGKLKNKFREVSGDADWAKLKWQKADPGEEVESDEEASALLRSTGNYLETSDSLPRNVIQLKPCTDANKESPAQGRLKSVEFHPSAQVLLAAGMDQRLSLFQVDGKNNPKIQSIFLKTFPIYNAHFTQDGREVIMTSRLKSFYYYDMIAGSVVNVPKIKGLEEKWLCDFKMSPDGKWIVFLGQHGHMHLLSAQTKELIDTLKMNGSVESIAFAPDSSKMYSHGDDGEVYVWDMRSRQCVHHFTDDGCVKGTAVAASPNGQYLAAGSYSGVVNIYDTSTIMTSRRPQPVKAVMNLTSPCTQLRFNPATEILAAASNYAESAVKLVHFPSMSVFQNFPDSSDPLRIVQSMDFSARGGYFTMANHKGRALLYRVKHYADF